MPRFRTPEARQLCALALAFDPSMGPWLRQLFRMGVRNIRHDWMHTRRNDGSDRYDRVPDPGAWSGDITPHIGVMLLRPRDGEWFLNGF